LIAEQQRQLRRVFSGHSQPREITGLTGSFRARACPQSICNPLDGAPALSILHTIQLYAIQMAPKTQTGGPPCQ
jgi:hypothetical protein